MAHIFQICVLPVLHADQEGVDAVSGIVVGHLALGVRQQTVGTIKAHFVGELFQRTGGQHKRNRQHLAGFVGGVAVHDSLIASALAVHTKRDVRALPGDMRGDLVVAVVRHLGQKKRAPGKHSIERLV